MAIVYQKDAGLGQGITALGQALGQGISQYGQSQYQTALQRAMEERQKVAQQEQLKSKFLYDLALTQEKEKLKQTASQDYLSNLGITLPGQAQEPLLTRQKETTSSPIQNIANAQSQPMEEGIVIESQENLGNLTDEQITGLILSRFPEHNRLGEAAFKKKEQAQRKFEADRKYHSKGAAESEKFASGIRRGLDSQESALALSRQAIESGDTGPLSWSNVAQRLGIPELMNEAGTQLSQAGKEFFFGNMQRLSARAQNQWLEQRITQLSAQVGDPQISALAKQVMQEGDLKLGKAYITAYDKIASDDMQKYGYVRNDVERRAYDAIKPESDEILKETSYKTRMLYEQEKGVEKLKKDINKKVPAGTMLTDLTIAIMSNDFKGKDGKVDSEKLIEKAKKLGYTRPTKEQRSRWQ